MDISNDFAIKTSHYIIGGLSVVAAFAWRDMIHDALARIAPENSLKAKILYAVLITIFLVIVIWTLPDTFDELPKDVRKKIERENMKRELQILRRAVYKN